MARENIQIVITTQGTRRVRRDISDIGREARRSGTAVRELNGILQGLGVGLGVQELLRYADAFVTIRNQLSVVIPEQERLNSTVDDLFAIARRTRTEVEGIATLYNRVSFAARELGVDQQELSGFLEQVGQALTIQGATTQTARGALIQLAQAMGTTVVRAEEFNSINEGALPIIVAVAENLEAAGGSVARLRREVIAGNVTSRAFFEAFRAGAADLAERFARTTPTIRQAFIVLNDAIINLVGALDSANGLLAPFSAAIISVADALIALAEDTRPAEIALAALTPIAIAGVLRLGALLFGLLGPLGVVAAAVGGLIALATGLSVYRDEIIVVEDRLISLGDVFRAVGEAGTRVFNDLSTVVQPIIDSVNDLTLANISLGAVLESLALAPVRLADAFLGTFIGLGRAIGTAFGSIEVSVTNLIRTGSNLLVELEEDAINTVNRIQAFVTGTDFVETILPREALIPRGESLGQEIADAFVDGFESRPIESTIAGIIDRAAEFSELRRLGALLGGEGAGSPTGVGGGPPPTLLSTQQTSQLQQLIGLLDPVANAIRRVQEAEELLNAAVATGAISSERRSQLLEALGRQYRDQLDPLAAVNLELGQERELLELSVEARADATRFLELENQLRADGVSLTAQSAGALMTEITSLRQLADIRARELSILESINQPFQDYIRNTEAAVNLFERGEISSEQLNQSLTRQRIEFLETQRTASAGIERGILRLQENLGDLASATEETFTSVFSSMEDAIVNFVATGRLEFSSLVDSIVADITRLAVQESITGPLSQALGIGGAGAGASAGGGVASLLGAFGLPGFQTGGQFTVGGAGGIDSQLVAFRATPGERVNVDNPNNGARSSGGGVTIVQNITTPDAGSFRQSQGQIAAEAQAAASRASRRNN